MSIIMVGIGGFIGACSRFLFVKLFEQFNPPFPLATLLSNVIAALIIGFIIGMERQTSALPDNTKLFLTTGLLGGLSTFSTFSMETVRYFEGGKYIFALGNILLNVGLSILFVFIGLVAAKTILKAV